MSLDLPEAEKLARKYIGAEEPLKPLGWGVSGFVFSNATAGLPTAVKVHRTEQGFESELTAYQVLRQEKVFRLHGLTIPRIRGYRESLRIVEMDLVSPPFLLDFAGVHFEEPDYEEHVWEHWHSEISERFGNNAHFAYQVYNSLQRHGMYYMDLRPSNLNLKGLEGVVDEPPTEEEDQLLE